MIIKSIILILFFSIHDIPRKFYYKESKCAFAYTITREWSLELKNEQNFNLLFSTKDTRFKKSLLDTIIGKWSFSNDTLQLILQQRKRFYPDRIMYLLKKDELDRIGFNALLPEAMKASK